MHSTTNSISLNYRSYDENSRDTDLNVNIDCEHIDDAKLARYLTTWLRAIDSNLTVQLQSND